MNIEHWAFIPGFEGLYMVSDLGRIKSLNYKNTGKEKILKLTLGKRGYYTVVFHKDGNQTSPLYVHRLVWLAFKGDIPNGLVVNHINENKLDNRLTNLNLLTRVENLQYGTAKQRMAKSKTGKYNIKTSKPVAQYTLDGILLKIYPSQAEAQRQTGCDQRNISACCTGRYNYAYGYVWKYAEKEAS